MYTRLMQLYLCMYGILTYVLSSFHSTGSWCWTGDGGTDSAHGLKTGTYQLLPPFLHSESPQDHPNILVFVAGATGHPLCQLTQSTLWLCTRSPGTPLPLRVAGEWGHGGTLFMTYLLAAATCTQQHSCACTFVALIEHL